MNQQPIRVMVVDDHTLIREGARALMASLPDLEHIGEASTGQAAITLAAELTPDVESARCRPEKVSDFVDAHPELSREARINATKGL